MIIERLSSFWQYCLVFSAFYFSAYYSGHASGDARLLHLKQSQPPADRAPTSGAKDGGSVARQDRSGPSSSLPPPAPHTSSPPSRPNSGEPWFASSVGGPGVQNMTGIGTSARNSHAIGYHQGDHQHSASHFVVSQGNSAGAYDTTPYSNHNLNYPQNSLCISSL